MRLRATSEQVVEAVHDACRPEMATDRWCINAAAITRLVLRELRVPGWPVQCTIEHMNAAYAEHVRSGRSEAELPNYWDAKPGEPYAIWAQAVTQARASAMPWQAQDGLPGHVVTWVPLWGCYLDPSADQFSRPAYGIELGPCCWQAKPPPEPAQYLRDDGGVTILLPTRLRGFTSAGAWRHRNDRTTRQLAGAALELLA